MPLTLLAVGLTVFGSHLLSALFRRTNLPDVLVLMLIGIAVGPWSGLVRPGDFGAIGDLIATVALVVILFESGTSLDVGVMRRSIGTTGVLTVGCYLGTAAIVGTAGVALLALAPVPALMLGVTLAGTSSAVVIPMVATLTLSPGAATVLVLESALTDVLCIVGVVALLEAQTQGQFQAVALLDSVLTSLAGAALVGAAGGLLWLVVHQRVRDFPNTITTTLAFVLMVYGATEQAGFSGPIAALMLGIFVGNGRSLGARALGPRAETLAALTPEERALYGEAVFLLKTYFFVYLGVHIRLGEARLAGIAVVTMVLVFAMRIAVTRVSLRGDAFSARDAAVASMLAPKGLAAAVLAGLPLQNGVPGGEVIRDAAYTSVLVSITLCALLVVVYPWPPVRRAYARALGKPDAPPAPLSPGETPAA